MKNQIRRAFSPLHASEHTLEEVLRMIDTPKKNNAIQCQSSKRVAFIIAAMVIMLALMACVADQVINHREIFFFDTLKELMQKQSEEMSEEAAQYYGVPGTAEENKDVETPAQYVDRAMQDGLLGEETVISYEEKKDPTDGWERRRVAKCRNDLYGAVATEYLAGKSYADRITVDGLIDWDLTCLPDTLTPEPGGQMLLLCRNAENEDLIWTQAHLGYTTDSGKRFSLTYEYNTVWNYGEMPEYILNSAYDQSEIFVTKDGAQALLLSYDGQVWANAVNGHKAVYLYTTGYTVEEMKTILNNLNLSPVLASDENSDI